MKRLKELKEYIGFFLALIALGGWFYERGVQGAANERNREEIVALKEDVATVTSMLIDEQQLIGRVIYILEQNEEDN